MKNLKPIKNNSLAGRVEDRLIEYFKQSHFSPGDSLPAEMELAAALEVSRPVIREALSGLRMLGLVESRKRRGMVLQEPDVFGAMKKVLIPNLLSVEAKKDMFELRLMLEIGIADLLFLRKTENDIQKLTEIVDAESKLFEKKRTPANIRELVEIDLAFHSQLYKISANKTLERLQAVLLPTIRHMVEVQFRLNPLSYGKVTHGRLLEILKTGTPDDFRVAMRGHLELHFEALEN